MKKIVSQANMNYHENFSGNGKTMGCSQIPRASLWNKLIACLQIIANLMLQTSHSCFTYLFKIFKLKKNTSSVHYCNQISSLLWAIWSADVRVKTFLRRKFWLSWLVLSARQFCSKLLTRSSLMQALQKSEAWFLCSEGPYSRFLFRELPPGSVHSPRMSVCPPWSFVVTVRWSFADLLFFALWWPILIILFTTTVFYEWKWLRTRTNNSVSQGTAVVVISKLVVFFCFRKNCIVLVFYLLNTPDPLSVATYELFAVSLLRILVSFDRRLQFWDFIPKSSNECNNGLCLRITYCILVNTAGDWSTR